MMLSRVDIALPLLEPDTVRTRHFADLLTQPLLIWFPLITSTILIGQDYLGQVVVCDPYDGDSLATVHYVNTLCGTTILNLQDTIFLMFASAARVSLRQMPLLLIFQALAFRLLIFAWDIGVGDKLNCVIREWNTLITDLSDALRVWYRCVQEESNDAESDLNGNSISRPECDAAMRRRKQNDMNVKSEELETEGLLHYSKQDNYRHSNRVHPSLRLAHQLVVDAREMLTDWLDTRSRVLYFRFVAYTTLCFLVCALMSVIMGSINSLMPQSASFNCTARDQQYKCVYRYISGLRIAVVCNMGFFVVGACAHLCAGVYLTVPMSPLNSFFCHKVAGLYYCLKHHDAFYSRPKVGLRLLSLYMAHNKCLLKDLERLKRFTRAVKERHLYSLEDHVRQAGLTAPLDTVSHCTDHLRQAGLTAPLDSVSYCTDHAKEAISINNTSRDGPAVSEIW